MAADKEIVITSKVYVNGQLIEEKAMVIEPPGKVIWAWVFIAIPIGFWLMATQGVSG